VTYFLLALVFVLIFVLWYALAGRAWLKSKSWTAGFFTWIEPFEIAIFKKSESVLVGRLLWIGGLFVTGYDSIAVFISSLDLTPLTTRILDGLHIPSDMRGLTVTAFVAMMGRLILWLRKRTTKPLEVVAVASKDVTPAVAQALVAAEVSKDEAVAAVNDAKAA
jgi:hypothetical protein